MVANTTQSSVPSPSMSSEKIESILLDYTELHLHLAALARKHEITIDALLDLVRDPEARKRIETLRALADDRTDVALDLALPMAIDRLVDLMGDESAPPESRRKAASQIIRYHTQRRSERDEARERRPPPVPPQAVPPTTAAVVGAGAQRSTKPAPRFEQSEALSPSPLGREVEDSPWRVADPSGRSRERGRPPSPAAQPLNRAATPVCAP